MTSEIKKALNAFERNGNAYTLQTLVTEVGSCAINGRSSDLREIERKVDEIYERGLKGGVSNPSIEGIRFVIKEYCSKSSVNKKDFA
jgi:hypothetical protein